MSEQIIKLKPELMDLVETGQKISTCRLGVKDKYHLGAVVFQNSEVISDKLDIGAEIVKIELVSFEELTDEIAENECYKNVKELKRALQSIYGYIGEEESITVIEWYR